MKLQNYMCIGGARQGEVVTKWLDRKRFYSEKYSDNGKTLTLQEYVLETFGRGKLFYRIWVCAEISLAAAEEIIKRDYND